MKITFLVQGSSPEPYKVIFENHDDNKMTAFCTCQAGDFGDACKHRWNIIEGKTENIIDGDKSYVPQIMEWYSKSSIKSVQEEVKQELKKIDEEEKPYKIKYNKMRKLAKRKVADAMHGKI